jgi:hypothetical protein
MSNEQTVAFRLDFPTGQVETEERLSTSVRDI